MSASVQNARPRNRRPNHMPNSNRGGYSNTQRREFSDFETPQSPSHRGIYEDQRTAAMLCTVLGAHSTVKTKNGHKYKGHTTGFSDRGDIAMVDAKLEMGDNAVEQHIPGIVIPKDNFVVCITNEVDMKGLSSGSSEFTDAVIAARVNGSSQAGMKELQPWQDEDADTTASLTLDDDQSGGWEPTAMFQANRMKFNLQSSYNEDMREYTTDLPDPSSEGYEELHRYAKMKAEEIERSEVYRTRIAKEDDDGDEESKYSSVHRNDKDRSVSGSADNNARTYVSPALRAAAGEHPSMRNGSQSRTGSRPVQRQSSPNYPQVQNSRQPVNNHYSQAPPLPQRTPRQPKSHSPNDGASAPHPVPPSLTVSHTQPPQASSQFSRPQQAMSQSTQNSKPNIAPHVSFSNQQQTNIPKFSHSQGLTDPKPTHLHSSQQQVQNRPPSAQNHMNGGDGHMSEPMGLSNPTVPTNATSFKSSEPMKETLDHKSGQANVPESASDSSSLVQGSERRNGRGLESNQEESRNKTKETVKQLKDFSKTFVLNDSGNKSQESSSESTEDNSNKSSSASSGISSTDSAANSESIGLASPVTSSSPEQLSATTNKVAEKPTESEPTKSETPKSTLNPYAAEFKPKTQATPPIEAPPSASPVRASPHVIQPTFAPTPNMAWVPASAITYPGRTKAVLPVGRDLTAQVTGQPLLAHGQPMIYMHGQGQSYQVYAHNHRMVAPNSFAATQASQQGNLDQSSPQPPQVFAVASQQPLVPGPIPAHLTHHPQPAHGQQMPNSGQQPQPAHIPNPAPSPVQHQQQLPHQHQQQQPQNHGGQPMPHPMPQGPPQSVTPQPAHYPHVNLQPNMQTMPRSSAAQHIGGPGHPSVSLNYPLHQYTYSNVSSSQNSYVPAPQPQMSQSNNHPNSGHQYVVMPQPQGHNPMQPINGHHYSAPSIQFQPQNILHGPPQMPPSHGHSHNQGANFIHHGVQGMPAGLQQVPGGPSSVLMSMQSPLQPYQPQQ